MSRYTAEIMTNERNYTVKRSSRKGAVLWIEKMERDIHAMNETVIGRRIETFGGKITEW